MPLHLLLLLLGQLNHFSLRPLLLKLQFLLYLEPFCSGVDIQQQQCLHDQILFDVFVERCIGGKTWSVVDFKQDWLQFVVD